MGFASYGSACAGALVVLETPQIILSLEKRFSSQCKDKDPPPSEVLAIAMSSTYEISTTPTLTEPRRSVQALLGMISSNHPGQTECTPKRTPNISEHVIHNDSQDADLHVMGPLNVDSLDGDTSKRLVTSSDDEIEQFRMASSVPCESDGHYSPLHTHHSTPHIQHSTIIRSSEYSDPVRLCRCGMSHSSRRNRKRPLHPLAHAPKSERLCSASPLYLEEIVLGGIVSGANTSNRSPTPPTAKRYSSVKKNSKSLTFSDHLDCHREQPGVLPSSSMCAVYVGKSAAGRGVQSRLATPVPYTVPDGGVGTQFKHSLLFDASFESANLLSAVQRGTAEYDLFLRADLHTEGYMQWFYFGITNTHPMDHIESCRSSASEYPDYIAGLLVAPRVTFNIVNLTKPDSLFNIGMQPVMYSCADAAEHGVGWIRSGTRVDYCANQYTRNLPSSNALDSGATYFTLSFTLTFERPDDVYLIAHSYPYTYSDHKAHLASLLRSSRKRRTVRNAVLCSTLDGHDCDFLTITSDDDDPRLENGVTSPEIPQFLRRKKTVILSARVHPGETPASWMMRGILDFLIGKSNEARTLRSLFVFKIVPMLNPDGVLYGNNRCSLAGVDLNRYLFSFMN